MEYYVKKGHIVTKKLGLINYLQKVIGANLCQIPKLTCISKRSKFNIIISSTIKQQKMQTIKILRHYQKFDPNTWSV